MVLLLVLLIIAVVAAAYQQSFVIGLLALALLGLLATAALKHRLLKSFMMLTTSLFASWAALEGALLLLEQPSKAEVAFSDAGSDEPASFWRASQAYGVLPSEGSYRARKVTTSGDVIYDVVYTIDAGGFRRMPEQDDAAVGSVNFLGGSATFGEGLNDDQTLPHHFSIGEPGREIRNRAVSGWGLHQAYALWENEIDERGATIIVQTAPWHADRAACIPKYSGLSPRYEIIDGNLERTGRCRTWFDNDKLSRAMLKSGLLQRLYDVTNRQNKKNKMDLYFKVLDNMNRLAADRGQCFIVAFNKAEEIWLQETEYTNQEIVEVLDGLGLDVTDTTLANRREDLDPTYFIVGDGHPSNEANQARAALLTEANERCEQKLLAYRAGR